MIRFLFVLMTVMFSVSPVMAQETEGDFDLLSIGQDLADDTTDFYSRNVYFDQNAIAEDADLTLPIKTQEEMKDWVEQAVGSVLTLDYNNHPQKLEIAKGFFTDNGYKQFLYKLEEVNLIALLEENNYSLSSVASGRPRIVGEGIDGTRYRWAFDAPIMMSYVNDKGDTSFEMLASIDVIRVPFSQNETGIAIDSWILKPNVSSGP